MTWWPLVVHWRLTQTAQSFPYRRALPGPAGFDINTRLWLTEALALGRAPGAFTVHSALLLACWFTVPGGRSLIHFPSQFAHRAPRKNRPPAIYLLYDFLRSQWRKTSPRSLHLFQLMCSRPPLVLVTGEKPQCHKFHVDLPSPPPGTVRTKQEQGVLYVCQFNARRSDGAHIESCCVCIINMCVGVYVARRSTWSWH